MSISKIDNIDINVKNRVYELLEEHLDDLLLRTTKQGFDKSWILNVDSLIPMAIKIILDKNTELEAKIKALEERL